MGYSFIVMDQKDGKILFLDTARQVLLYRKLALSPNSDIWLGPSSKIIAISELVNYLCLWKRQTMHAWQIITAAISSF